MTSQGRPDGLTTLPLGEDAFETTKTGNMAFYFFNRLGGGYIIRDGCLFKVLSLKPWSHMTI